MRTVLPSRLLKLSLVVDAVASGALALLQVVAPDALGRLLRLPPGLLLETGVFLVGFTWLLVVMARSERLWSPLVAFIVVGNVGWAAGCAALLGTGVLEPNWLGLAFVSMQALAVLAFAAAEYLGLRQSAPAYGRATQGWQSGS